MSIAWLAPVERIGVGEDTGAKRGVGNDRSVRQRGVEPIPFIVQEKESLVLADRAAERCAVEIPHVRILGGNISGDWIDLVIEEVACAQRVPPAEVISIAVEGIRCPSA